MPNFDASFFPWVDFSRPWWLAAILPLGLWCWWMARRRLGGWDSTRSLVILFVRCVVIALLVGALADPHIVLRSRSVAMIVVRDRSDSVPTPSQAALDQFLAASGAQRQPFDRIGVVTAAAEPMVAAVPRQPMGATIDDFVADRSATDLAGALALAGAIAPADAGTRVLLASDGNQTRGDVLAAARALASRGIAVDAVVLPSDRRRRTAIEDVIAPTWSRPGAPADIRVVLRSGRAVEGRLSLTLNGSQIDLTPGDAGMSRRVALDEGLNVLTIPVLLGDEPVQRFRAVFEPDTVLAEDDARGLSAEAITFVQSRGRVLAVVDDTAAAAPLLDAMRSDEVRIDVVDSAQCPSGLEEFAGYDGVVLVNQPADRFSQTQQAAMRAYVHDAGGGLIMTGGPDAFGAGGWIGSPLAEALPIVLDPPQKRQLPMGALAIIIDCSGSMGTPVAGTNLDQQTIANDAAVLGIRTLSRLDDVTVIAFNDGAEVIVPLRRCTDPEAIGKTIRSILPGGGTNLFPAIDAAAAQLAKSHAGLKHVIILTDGETTGDPKDGFAKAAELKRKNITLSTVMIGDAANSGLLRRLAQIGGGQCYPVRSENAKAVLPQIFIKEAQLVRRSLIWEGTPFVPVSSPGVEGLRGLPSPLPAIAGYVVTADRGGLSTVALRGPENDPILAQWQHGLGRVTVFTSDATARWDPAWMQWPGFQAFWRQQLQWTMRPLGDAKSRLTIDTDGSHAGLMLELFDPDGEPLNFATVRGRIVSPGGDGTEVTLRQVGPGRYAGEYAARGAGAHVVNLSYSTNSSDRPGIVRGAVVRRLGDELAAERENSRLMAQVAAVGRGRLYRVDGGGADLWSREGLRMPTQRVAIWALCAAAAIGLFVMDVAVRRIVFSRAAVAAALVGLVRPAVSRRATQIGGLAAARERARASMAAETRTAPPLAQTLPVEDAPSDRDVPVVTSPPVGDRAAPIPPVAPPTSENDPVLARLRAAKHRARHNE